MASAKRPRKSSPDPGPTVFVLFGATGDLAKRMVLPAFYRLAIEGLLPRQWLLVGNGRGDVAHEEFRAHVHDVLTEFGPHPQQGAWESFAQGAHLSRRRPAAGPLPRGAAGRLRRADEGSGRARAGQGRPRRLREAVRHITAGFPRPGPRRPLGA